MSRDIVALLRYEAQRKPDIAALLERAATLTDEEIDAAKVPLPWYRQALRKVRDHERLNSPLTWEQIAPFVHYGIVPDAEGDAFRFEGDIAFVTTDGGGQLQVLTGHLVWFPKTGGVWIEEVFASKIDSRLMTQVSPLGPMTRNQFKDACRQRIMRSHGIVGEVQEVDPNERQIGGFAFKVQR